MVKKNKQLKNEWLAWWRRQKVKRYWKLKTQQQFLRRFTELLEHGFSISEALEVMKVLFRPKFINFISESCAKGLPFSETLGLSQFDPRIIYLVRCNEQAGALLQGLQKARGYSQHRLENQGELKKKLRYPCFLFFMMLVALGGIYLFFLPQLQQFYDSFNLKGNQNAINGIVILMGVTLIIIVSFGIFAWVILRFFHPRFHKGLFQLMGIRKLSQRLFTYYFSTHWLMLLECGLPLKESLATIRSFEKIPVVRHIVHEFEKRLKSGEELDSVIGAMPYFTPYFKLIMTHALRIGCVESELSQFNDGELKRLNRGLNLFFKGFQTSFLLLIGIMIILLYLSILQPVFEMIQLL